MLHTTVNPSRWCVTRTDLIRLRSDVVTAIMQGEITPTNLDKFDPQDRTFGPSMYTVNEQYIKPVTAMVGNTSWALMLHPHGLECDLFVSHAWQEGFFELVDKILASWPRGARHVYCCILANPQNLNISSLISKPSESPFAEALRCARWVLVVPNRKSSIYSRIWCTYEAYLAYRWRKVIFTARQPIGGLGKRVRPLVLVFALVTIFVMAYCAAAGVTSLEQCRKFFRVTRALSHFFLVTSVLVETEVVVRSLNYMFVITYAVNRGLVFSSMLMNWESFCEILPSSYHTGLIFLLPVELLIVCAFSELDCITRAAERKQTRELLRNFSGHVMDAECSVQRDGERIKDEIRSNGEEQAVDRAVRVLIHAGMSTPDLQEADACGIDITGAAYCSYSQLALSLLYCLHESAWFGMKPEPWSFRRCSLILTFFEALALFARLLFLSSDRRRFAARVASTLILPGQVLQYAIDMSVLFSDNSTKAIDAKHLLGVRILGVVVPLTLIVSLVGVRTLIRLPMVGTTLARVVLSRKLCQCIGFTRSRHSYNINVGFPEQANLELVVL